MTRRKHRGGSSDLASKRRFAEIDRRGQRLREVQEARQRDLDRLAMESLMLNGQEFVNRYESLPVGFGFGGDVSGIGMSPLYRSDQNQRFEGQDWPFYVTEQDVSYARGMARFISTVQCPAVGIQENLLNYIVGTGPTVAISPAKHADVPENLVPFVQDIVDEFLTENNFKCDRDREFFWRACRDGESFLAFYPKHDGFTECRFIEPELVIDPGAAPWDDDELWRTYGTYVDCATNWRWGIHTADHDVEKVYGYVVQWVPSGPRDYLPARYVEHWKLNRDSTVKRGLTDFYPAWKWINDQARLLANTTAGATELSAIAYILQNSQASQQQMENMRAAHADQSYSIMTPAGGMKTYYKEYRPPGSVLTAPKGQEYLPGPAGSERGNAFLQVVQGILKQVATRFCMTEGMVSGDDSANNRASMAEAGSRFHQFAVARQGMLVNRFTRIIWKALEFAYDQNVFRQYGYFMAGGKTFRELKRALSLQIEFPDVDPKQKKENTERRVSLHRERIMSAKTAMIEEGLDPEEEETNLTKEAPPQGGAPGGMPGMPGMPGMDGGLPDLGADPGADPGADAETAALPVAPVAPVVAESLVPKVPEVIEVPDVRQDDGWSCGAAAAMSVGVLRGVGPKTLPEWKDLLGTTEQHGTGAVAIVDVLGLLGLSVTEQHRMSLADLSAHLEAGRPVLCPVQDYDSTPEDYDSGHWLTVIGRIPGAYIIVQDSSEDNAMHMAGGTVDDPDPEKSLAAPGRKLIREEDWLQAWHDRDDDGRTYIRYGIAVGLPRGGVQEAKIPARKRRVHEQFAAADTDARVPTTVHEFSYAFVEVPTAVSEHLRSMAERIPDWDLAPKGREDEPHITLRFGLNADDAQAVRQIVEGFGPITVTLGKTSVFPARQRPTASTPADVVKVDVVSQDLHRLNSLLAKLPQSEQSYRYVPHITLAYVRPGSGDKYAGIRDLDGVKLRLNSVVFRGKDGARTDIPLGTLDVLESVSKGHSHGSDQVAGSRQPIGDLAGGRGDGADGVGPLLGASRLLAESQPRQTGGDVHEGSRGGTGPRPTGGRPYVLPWERAEPADRRDQADGGQLAESVRAGSDGRSVSGQPVLEVGASGAGRERLRDPGDLAEDPAGDGGARGLAPGADNSDCPAGGSPVPFQLAGVAESLLQPADAEWASAVWSAVSA